MTRHHRPRGTGEHDRPVPWRFRLSLFAVGLATWALQLGVRGEPEWVESVYATRIYPVIRELVGTLSGWTSYSFFELFALLALLVMGYRVSRNVRATFRGRRSWRNLIAHTLSGALALAGLFYAWGMIGWGFNYYRQPFLQIENLDRVGIAPAELEALGQRLIGELNTLRKNLAEDDAGVMRSEDSAREALHRAPRAFGVRALEYASLRDSFVSQPKGLVLPVLPWLSVSGIFFPYTGEPNVSMEQPVHGQLFAACHELAHQQGWAREEEANFVGYAVCRRHPDADYRYAAAHAALLYTLGALRRVDADAAARVVVSAGPGLKRDWDAAQRFWERYDTFLGDAASRVNDAYLKANGQQQGIESYGLMVDLLVADQRRAH